MENSAGRIRHWAEAGKHFSLPQWEELPTIPLYMDQVLLYLQDSLRLFEQDESFSLLTSSMINNYVKNGVLPHPEKKKYRQEHLAALLAICMLKQVLPIQDIKTLFSHEAMDRESFSLFLSAHISAMRETCSALSESCEANDNLKHTALRLAVEANAKRAAAERILFELKQEEEAALQKPDRPGKKQSSKETP